MKPTTIKFIDLFAGMGGTRIGFEEACQSLGYQSECVFTSEIKPYAVELYAHNFGDHNIHGDITNIHEQNIPDFDFLLGGFPCQAFSVAGKRAGFNDTRHGYLHKSTRGKMHSMKKSNHLNRVFKDDTNA